MAYDWQVYFSSQGDHVRTVYHWDRGYTNRSNFVFRDTLQLMHINNKGAVWKSLTNDRQYTTFISDFDRFVPHLVEGIVRGLFTFHNHSGYTGLIPFGKVFEDYLGKEVYGK